MVKLILWFLIFIIYYVRTQSNCIPHLLQGEYDREAAKKREWCCKYKGQDGEHFEEQDVAGQLISIVVVHSPMCIWHSTQQNPALMTTYPRLVHEVTFSFDWFHLFKIIHTENS